MKRRAVAAVVLMGVGIGLIDPYACVQHSSGSPARREVPARERTRVLEAARRALALLPAPRGYRLDRESVTSEAAREADWDGTTSRWAAPVAARAERLYEPAGGDAPGAPPPLEQRVFVNGGVSLPTGLASVGGAPRPFVIRGAVAVLVPTAGVEDPPAAEGRVALPVSPEGAANSLAIVRVVVASVPVERSFEAAARSGAMSAPPRKPPRSAGSVEAVVVELYGGRRDVETAARRIPTAKLRALLTR